MVRTDGRTDTEGYNIIPRHTLVAGYKNELPPVFTTFVLSIFEWPLKDMLYCTWPGITMPT